MYCGAVMAWQPRNKFILVQEHYLFLGYNTNQRELTEYDP